MTDTQSGVELEVTWPQVVLAGEPIPVSVTLRNGGDDPVPYSSSSAGMKFNLQVTTAVGHNVTRTAKGTALMPSDELRRTRAHKLPGGESVTESNMLDELFELKEPATFRLSVYSNVGPVDHDGSVRPISIMNLPLHLIASRRGK